MDRVQGGAFVCLLRYVCPGCFSTFVRTDGYLNSADFLCVFSDHLSPVCSNVATTFTAFLSVNVIHVLWSVSSIRTEGGTRYRATRPEC